MNIKFVAGFLAGIMLVVSVWYFFPDIRERLLPDGETSKSVSLITSLEEKKRVVQETNFQNKGDIINKSYAMETETPSSQNAVDKQVDTADAVTGDGDGKIEMQKHIQEQNRVSWAEVDRSSPDVVGGLEGKNVIPGNSTDTTQNEFKTDESKITDYVSDMEVSSNTPDKKDTETMLSASDEGEKFFFWKSFFLESKAKKFAALITSGSNVNCLVDKTGTGHYQVYYLYKDEADKLAKAGLIKNIGITF